MATRKKPDGLIIDDLPEAGSGNQPGRRLGGWPIDFKPPPPESDVLDSPLVIEQRPRVILPRRSRLDDWLDGFLSFLRSEEEQQRQDVHRTIAELIAIAWPQAIAGLRQKGWLRDRSRPVRPLRNVQQLTGPVEKMMVVPARLATERKALEILLAMILRAFAKRLSERKGYEFAFESRSRLHGLLGYRSERMLKHIDDPEEWHEALQTTFNNYYHSVHYYHCSLLARDFPINEGTLFGLYCRAAFFMARLGRDGTLQATPAHDRLPSRERILFLLTRDKAVRRRYSRDPDYAHKIRSLVRAFPDRK